MAPWDPQGLPLPVILTGLLITRLKKPIVIRTKITMPFIAIPVKLATELTAAFKIIIIIINLIDHRSVATSFVRYQYNNRMSCMCISKERQN